MEFPAFPFVAIALFLFTRNCWKESGSIFLLPPPRIENSYSFITKVFSSTSWTGLALSASPCMGNTLIPKSSSWLLDRHTPVNPCSPACPGSSEWQHNHSVYQPFLSVLYYQFTWWRCTLSHHPNGTERCWPQYWPLPKTASVWLPNRLCTADDKPLSPAHQPVLNPLH